MGIGKLTNLSRSLLALCACACVFAACDTQASTGYRGEPMLSVTGSVVLTRSRVEGPLVPAIAFVNERTELHFLDVEVQGEFPSSFTFHVYEPPPEAAFPEASEPENDEPAEPSWAVGYITVVPREHVSSVQRGVPLPPFSSCTGDDVCRAQETWCTQNRQECYVEMSVCEHASSPMPDCTIETSGSEELKQTVFSQFEGLALTYRILYLKTAAVFADEAGAPEELAAGYHLFRVESLAKASPEKQVAAYDACQRAIRTRALQLYNERHGTELTFEQVYESMRCPECDEDAGDDSSGACAGECEGVSEETYAAVDALEDAAGVEVPCAESTEVVERIEDPLREPISIVIGPNLTPE